MIRSEATMHDQAFWKLIARIDRSALADGDEEAALDPLRAALAELERADLEGFEETLSQKLFALDGRRYADAAGQSGTSDDGFLYARCYVVARGKDFYEAVLADPKKMPTSIDDWCEGLLYITSEVHEAATGSEWTFTPSVSFETGSNGQQW